MTNLFKLRYLLCEYKVAAASAALSYRMIPIVILIEFHNYLWQIGLFQTEPNNEWYEGYDSGSCFQASYLPAYSDHLWCLLERLCLYINIHGFKDHCMLHSAATGMLPTTLLGDV